MKIKISIKWMQIKFECTPEFIKNICKGRCCEGSKNLLISLLPNEEEKINELNIKCYIKNGHLLPKNGTKCPFKNKDELCTLHNTELKPFGCILSPFTLNKNNTLVIRQRYLMFPCFGKGQPVYETFRNSLVLLFKEKTDEIITKIKNSTEDFYVDVDNNIINNIKYLDRIKK
jgi:hypothetical protein